MFLKKRMIYFIVTFTVLAMSLSIFWYYQNSIVDSTIQVFKKTVEILAESISASYFQWTEMYSAFLNNDDEFIQRMLNDIKLEFPEVENVIITVDKIEKDDLFEISSDETSIIIKFRIYNTEGTKYVPNKLVSILIPAQKILDGLHVRNILISKTGFNFIYNLKYKFRFSITDLIIFVGLLSISLILAILYLFTTERKLRQAESTEKLALEAITELTQSLLKGILEPSYQLLLQKAVQIIPGAQAGSVLTKEGEEFVFSAVVGYDFEALANLRLKPHELAQGFEKDIKIIRNIRDFDKKNLTDDKINILRSAGRVNEIKSTLSLPIVVDDEIKAFLNLDNLSNPDAFSELSVQIGKVFANQLGVIFERIKLEKELREQKERLEYLSLHDALTGLPNRRFLEIEGERLIALANRENKNLCLMYLDLKKFKPVNDTYGHNVGDYVLKVLSERFKVAIRKSDFVARMGGDEFVFLLYDCKEHRHFIDRILEEIEKDIYYNYIKINISGNFGIVFYPQDASTFGELITKGDIAMYYAKSNNLKYYLASNLNINSKE